MSILLVKVPILAENIIERAFIPEDVIKRFFKNFKSLMQRESDDHNTEITKLIWKKYVATIKVSSYKENYLISPVSIYQEMFKRRYQYEALKKRLFTMNFSLLILPSTANVDRGFLLYVELWISTKLCNSLAPKTLDKLMRIVLTGPYEEDLDSATTPAAPHYQ